MTLITDTEVEAMARRMCSLLGWRVDDLRSGYGERWANLLIRAREHIAARRAYDAIFMANGDEVRG